MSKIWVAGKRTNLGVRGTRCGALLAGDEIRWYRGVATLDRGPDQSQRVRPIFPSHRELREPGGVPSWVEYRSGGTGDPHPGMDILSDLSPKTKPYCGVKCSQGLHFPATDCGSCRCRGHNSPTVKGGRGSSCGRKEPYLPLLLQETQVMIYCKLNRTIVILQRFLYIYI